MAIDPAMMLRVAGYHGISIRLVRGEMVAGPNRNITDEWKHRLGRWRPVIGPYVAEQTRLDETVVNVLSLDDADFEAWCQEIDAAPVGDPELAHDREARRRAVEAKRAAERAAEFDEEIAA